jgi:putative lipoprotein (rSAM/lipoprotein system)
MVKKTRRSLIKGANWILSGILSMLGFSGCDDTGNDYIVEYGTPHATFSFHGTVANKAGNPVKDIKIEIKKEGSPESTIPVPTITNEMGQYSTTFVEFPVQDFQVIVSDIDGEVNGSYQNDTIPVKVGKDDYYKQGDGHWNNGSADKEVNIVLKEKE